MTRDYFYVIRIQYLGFRYHGWAKQPNVKTVQGMVEKTIRFVLEHSNFKTLASGRTDAMVSAETSAFELFLREPINPNEFLIDFNSNLPADIRALAISEVDAKFNIIQSPKTKEYHYLFAFGDKIHPYCAPYMTHFKDDLDIELMQQGAKLFLGQNNFIAYCVDPQEGGTFEREIELSEIVENKSVTASFFPEDSYVLKLRGPGFMRQQIRLMMGTLVRLGSGQITLDEISSSLTNGVRTPIGFVAPASGLSLVNVEFG